MARKQTRTRDLTVDTVRGLACVLLVAYHVIGNDAQSGLRLTDGPYRTGADLLAYIRMPLFTFLSGYVYAWRPFHADLVPFLIGKARRLLIPMLVVGSLFVFIRMWIPGTNHSEVTWQMLHILPVEHFWFVESLFIVFLLIIPLEMMGILKAPKPFSILFAIIALLYISDFEFSFNYFSINGVFYLVPFFLAGLASSRFNLQLGRFYYPLLVIGLILPYLYIFRESQNAEWVLDRRGPLALWIGVTSSLLLVRSGLKNGVLAHVGHYSYAVYLFHVFFTAAARIFLTTMQIQQTFVLLIICTIAGLVGPVVLDSAASQHALSSILLLGKKRKTRQTVTHREASQPIFDTVPTPTRPIPE